MNDINLIIYAVSAAVIIISTIIVVYNFFTAPQLKNKLQDLDYAPFVSILIPARDEEKNIGGCLDSLLNQHYNNCEIIVYDDQSKDSTAEIVNQYKKKHSRILLISGTSLPGDWLGKNWACHQLSLKAGGDLLLFIDADILLDEHAINSAIHLYQQKQVSMLSVFPTQIVKSFGESLTVPLMKWLLLTFLPLLKVYASPQNSFVAANGQFIMFDRSVYFDIGGHEKVKSEAVEDMEFARILKRRGKKIIAAIGGGVVFCRMYRNFEEAFNGFTKNFYPGFKTSAAFFSLFLIVILIGFLVPIIMSFFYFEFIWLVFLILVQRVIIGMLTRQNYFWLLLHPFQMIVLLLIGINSIYQNKFGGIEWKGRKA